MKHQIQTSISGKMEASEDLSSNGTDRSESSSSSSGLEISEDCSDDELVDLPEDLRMIVKARKDFWAEWYVDGLCLRIPEDDSEDDPMHWIFSKIQYAPEGHWASLFEMGERNVFERDVLIGFWIALPSIPLFDMCARRRLHLLIKKCLIHLDRQVLSPTCAFVSARPFNMV